MTTEQYIDGKRYSTWRPEYKQNDIIVSNNNLTTNAKYRHFLMNNSELIKNKNFQIDINECGNHKTYNKSKLNSVPYIYKNDCLDEQTIAYSDSDLKRNYMNTYDIKCKENTISF